MNNDIMEATNRIAFKTKQGKISIDATKIGDSYYLLVNSKYIIILFSKLQNFYRFKWKF